MSMDRALNAYAIALILVMFYGVPALGLGISVYKTLTAKTGAGAAAWFTVAFVMAWLITGTALAMDWHALTLNLRQAP